MIISGKPTALAHAETVSSPVSDVESMTVYKLRVVGRLGVPYCKLNLLNQVIESNTLIIFKLINV